MSVESGERMGDWVTELTQENIRQVFGAPAAIRGWDYAFRGLVTSLTVMGDADRSLLGSVQGSAAKPYATVVSVHRVPSGWAIVTNCSCPVGYHCKHAVAVIFAAQKAATAAGQSRSGGTPEWERLLRQALSAGNRREVNLQAVPLALIFDVTTRRGTSSVVVRPGRPGKSKGKSRTLSWVKSGASWYDLEYRYAYDTSDPVRTDHREALLDFRALASEGSYRLEEAIDIDRFGSRLWTGLAALAETGVDLVGGSTLAQGVRLAPLPARLELTLRGDGGGLALAPSVRIGDVVLAPSSVDLLGNPVHGVTVTSTTRQPAGDEAALAVLDGASLLLVPLAKPASAAMTQLVSLPRELVVPRRDVPRFIAEYAPGLRQSANLVTDDVDLDVPEPEPPRLLVDITYSPGHVIEVVWSATYRIGDDVTRYPLRDDGRAYGRDLPAEAQIEQEILQIPGILDIDGLVLRTPYSAVLMPQARFAGLRAVLFAEKVLVPLASIDRVDMAVHGTALDYREAAEEPVVELSTRDTEHTDWFDLQVTVRVDDQEVPLEALFTAIAHQEPYVVLDSGTYFRVDRPELAQLRELIEEAKKLQDKGSRGLRLSVLHAGLWSELVALGVVAEQSARWRDAAGALLNLDTRDPAAPPTKLDATLRPYQLDGYQWLSLLWDLHLGGILADDMGLGKTLQVLAMVQRAVENGSFASPLLVVAPTSVLGTWASEAAKFTPGLRVVVVGETERRRDVPLAGLVADADVVVTSYALFRIDASAYHAQPWSGLVLDEAQFVKNHQAKTYQVARRLPAPFKLAVTGTPLENSLMDLWSLLSITAPGLYPNPESFTETYRKPIEQGRSPQMLATLRRRIRPLMLRRTKEDVAKELPPKQEQVVAVALNPAHRRAYDRHLQRERGRVLGLMADLSRNRIEVLAALTRLRQLALAPVLVDEKYAGIQSSKIDVLMEHVSELAAEGHRALVFSQFTGFLKLVRDRLDADGVAYSYLDGATRDRARRIEEFRAGDIPVFLISLKAGGFGLNLTEADYVFVLDPWWNPAAEEQAIDRTHRIGQDKTVMVYRLVSENTIEQKVVALQDRKRELFRDVVGEGSSTTGALTADDIRGLLDA